MNKIETVRNDDETERNQIVIMCGINFEQQGIGSPVLVFGKHEFTLNFNFP